MLKNLKLGAKLNILLVAIFFLILIISGGFLSVILERNVERTVTDKALVLIETMGAIREYTSTQINPELASRLETEDQFLPQTVPGYAAREVFEGLRDQPEYRNFFYKEATLNPTNLRDKADSFEAEIVNKFRDNPDLRQKSGFRRDLPGEDIFYIARPISINKKSCLRCHSTPEAAPKSQLATYGSENGFGWKLNEIVGVQMISVPASRVFKTARQLQINVLVILGGFLFLAMILINFFLKITITQPIKKMAQLAQKISTGDLSREFEHDANDEVGMLAASLNRMKVSLEIAMNMLNSETD
ncbi:MAG TPA: histidine kinase [Cyanothece sp. UBA12306]|nr:histidine kinase [Cyanothece sp. UBA12306]